jgi:hypothetical protein
MPRSNKRTPQARLLIAGRDPTKLIDGLDLQVSTVRGALVTNGHSDVPVQGVLCFTRADLPLRVEPCGRARGRLRTRRGCCGAGRGLRPR